MRYKTKRIILALVSLLLVFSLVSCGEIVNPNPPKPPVNPDTPDDTPPGGDDTPTEGFEFTVSFKIGRAHV